MNYPQRQGPMKVHRRVQQPPSQGFYMAKAAEPPPQFNSKPPSIEVYHKAGCNTRPTLQMKNLQHRLYPCGQLLNKYLHHRLSMRLPGAQNPRVLLPHRRIIGSISMIPTDSFLRVDFICTTSMRWSPPWESVRRCLQPLD